MAMAMAEWWEAAAAAIAAYTGMTTPAAFFTAVAVAAALYVAVSGLLARPAQAAARRREAAAEEEEERALEPLPPPVQIGEVTEEELRAYDGSDPKKPLLMAIKGQIYDVTQSRMFYGPGGPYALFAGRDASRALAKMSFERSDLTSDISGLGPFEAEALQEWEYKFKSKYVTVGTIKKTIPVTQRDIASSTVTTERDIDASILESNHVPEPKETGATNQGSVVGKATEMPVVDVDTSSHEDIEEKAKELLDSDATNASGQADAVEKPDEMPNVAAKNSSTEEAAETKETPDAVVTNSSSSSNIEKADEPKETPQLIEGENICKPEHATEKPNEAADAVGLNTTTSHEDVSSHQDGEEKLKETSDVEAKKA